MIPNVGSNHSGARSVARPKLPYLEVDKESLTGTLTHLPARDEMPLDLNEALAVEHYTKYI